MVVSIIPIMRHQFAQNLDCLQLRTRWCEFLVGGHLYYMIFIVTLDNDPYAHKYHVTTDTINHLRTNQYTTKKGTRRTYFGSHRNHQYPNGNFCTPNNSLVPISHIGMDGSSYLATGSMVPHCIRKQLSSNRTHWWYLLLPVVSGKVLYTFPSPKICV